MESTRIRPRHDKRRRHGLSYHYKGQRVVYQRSTLLYHDRLVTAAAAADNRQVETFPKNLFNNSVSARMRQALVRSIDPHPISDQVEIFAERDVHFLKLYNIPDVESGDILFSSGHHVKGNIGVGFLKNGSWVHVNKLKKNVAFDFITVADGPGKYEYAIVNYGKDPIHAKIDIEFLGKISK